MGGPIILVAGFKTIKEFPLLFENHVALIMMAATLNHI